MKVSDSLGRKEIGGRVCESWLHIRGDVIGLVGRDPIAGKRM